MGCGWAVAAIDYAKSQLPDLRPLQGSFCRRLLLRLSSDVREDRIA